MNAPTKEKFELSLTRRRDREPTAECTDNVIDLKMSMAGFNSFYHACEVYEGRSNYAVCQHTIDAVKENRVQLRSVCPDAINCGNCPALAMREQERTAGRALFFTDRRESLKNLRAASETPSGWGFGKPRTPLASLGRETQIPREMESPSSKVKASPQPAVKADKSAFNPDIAGRSLLGDAINNIMENKE